jgi:hypothetical protein
MQRDPQVEAESLSVDAEPRVPGPPPPLLEALSSLGPRGLRAGEMLREVVEQSQGSRPRTGDIIAYCCREALVAALSENEVPDAEAFREAERDLQRSKDAVVAGADAATLVEAIERFQDASAHYEGIHAARLSAVIQAFTGTAPARVKGDLFESLQVLVERLNSGLHAGTPIDESFELYKHTVDILQRVFVPLPEKLPNLRALAKKSPLDQGDVDELRQWAFDLRQRNYFFRMIEGTDWLEALWSDDLLRPLPSGLWPASAYLTRLIESGNARVCDWLNEQTPDPSNQVEIRSYLWLAWHCGSAAIPLASTIARMPALHHLVVDDIVTFLRRRGEAADPEGYVDLVDVLLNHVPDERASTSETLLRDFFRWTGTTHVAPRMLEIVGYKISRAHDANPRRLDLVAPIDELLSERGRLWSIELFLSIAAVIIKEALSTQPATSLIDALGEVAAGPRSRLIGYLIANSEISRSEKIALLRSEVESQDSYPETVEALKRLVAEHPDDEELHQQLLSALGEPPSLPELAELDAEDLDERQRHIHHWLPAMPAGIQEMWGEADAVVTGKIGKAPPDGRAIGPVIVTWGDRSPFEASELEQKKPWEAASQIRTWRPDERVLGGPSISGLASTLRQIVAARPQEWSQRPVEVIGELRHPTYIASYFRELTQHPGQLADTEAIVRAIQLTFSEPWPVDTLATDRFDFEADWQAPQQAGIDLLERIWAADVDLSSEEERAAGIVYEAARRRDDESSVTGERDALEAAINRPSMQALGAAFSHAKFVVRSGGQIPQAFQDLLEETLRLEGDTGLQARAVIATNLPFVWLRMAEWAQSSVDILFGPEAPGELGPATFDLYLKWGAPNKEMLAGLSQHYLAAIQRGADRAADHVALGYLWGVEPWRDIAYLLDHLIQKTGAVSEVGEFLARATFDTAESITSAVAYWEAVLDRELESDALSGLGWFAMSKPLDDETWLPLMARTAEQAKGVIEWAGKTAERASEHASNRLALSLIASLLTREADPWEASQVGEAGMRLLRESKGRVDEAARQRLRARLIEMEFFAAEDIE